MKCRVAVASYAAISLAACCHQQVKPVSEATPQAEMKIERAASAAPPANEVIFSAHTAPQECPTSLADCPDEGCGGGNNRDSGTNIQKNRTTVPNDPVEMTVGHFKTQFKELTDVGRKRENISDADRQTVETDEAVAVTVDGFVLDDRQEGPESCACNIPDALDYHIWLASNRTSAKPAAIVVEITPRIFNTSDQAVKTVMDRLKQEKTHVRVTGWPMFDPLHPEQIGKSRYTRWEVHPVVDIQEKVNGEWKSVFE